MKTFPRLSLLALLLASLACTTLMGAPAITPLPGQPTRVAPTPPIPATVAPPTVEPSVWESYGQSEVEIMEGIQTTLDKFVRAIETSNEESFIATLDPDNLAFRRFVKTRYLTDGGGSFPDLVVEYLTPRELGLVQAHLRIADDWAMDWQFRLVEGRWVIAEPTREQLGEPEETTTDQFQFRTYAWADEVNPEIMELMVEARAAVLKVLGKVPTETFVVNIRPAYSVTPFEDPNSIAFFIAGTSTQPDRIEIFAPHSLAFGYYLEADGWQVELRRTLVHEFTHATHQRSFDDSGSLNDWMVEGLAEYVSGGSLEGACDAWQADRVIPIVDTESSVVKKRDLGHFDRLEADEVWTAYSLGNSVVAYIADEHGGVEAFWKLAAEVDKVSNLEKAIPQAFGITYKEFDTGWRKWLEQRCQ